MRSGRNLLKTRVLFTNSCAQRRNNTRLVAYLGTSGRATMIANRVACPKLRLSFQRKPNVP